MNLKADRSTYAGLFFVTLATLMYQILLTRIFSVTMWYHFAFVAISVTMFGMTVGALVVYMRPDWFAAHRVKRQLAESAWWMGISIVLSFLTHLCIPFVIEGSLVSLYSIALTYVVISVPFVFSGICVCLALTRFPSQVSKLYAADLAGAALGCVLLIGVLEVTDGPTAVFVVALLSIAGAAFFAAGAGATALVRRAVVGVLLLAGVSAAHTVLVQRQHPLVRLLWVKQRYELRPLFEKWNSFSRIRIDGDPNVATPPFGWGLSSTYPQDRPVRQLDVTIDATAGTVMTAYDGSPSQVEHLKHDVTNVAHYLRSDARVVVVGTGGGRDVLSALTFKQKSVVGVEINGSILNALNGRFGDFTGHLDRRPEVTFVNDEARSYIARMKTPADIIQISLIDTWAATASGAFVLTENSLYTTESWRTFLGRLSPTGLLTVSRWYFGDRPAEVYRLATLAVTTLKEMGIENPKDHFAIVRSIRSSMPGTPDGVGTILVSRTPLSAADLDTLDRVCRDMDFQLVQSSRGSMDDTLKTIASGVDLEPLMASYPLNIAPPTDDSPFFFHMLRFKDSFRRANWSNGGVMGFNLKAVAVLGNLLLTVVALTSCCIIVPLWLTTERRSLEGALPLFVYFASIGFGFMLVEISQMQRLVVFLGHPTYGLSVVLFSLLLSGGMGSWFTERLGNRQSNMATLSAMALLLGAVALFGTITPAAIRAFEAQATPIRIAVAVGILMPLGFFMGMAFPLGMKRAAQLSSNVTPWLWGINGATSVCASVLAVVVALGSSISTSFWVGFACYACAAVSYAWATLRVRQGHAVAAVA